MTESGGRSRETRQEIPMNENLDNNLDALRGATKAVGALLFVALIVPFVVFAVPQLVLADHSFVVLSGSMEPAISPGDVVIVDRSNALEVGDVITFQRGSDIPTTHRIVEVTEGGYVTKGDANEDADTGVVPPDQVLGRVSIVIPLIGHVVLWAKTPLGTMLLVVAPITALIALELRDSRWWRGATEDADGSVRADDAEHDDSDRADAGRVARVPEPAPAPVVTVSQFDMVLTAWTLFAFTVYAGWTVVSGWQRAATLSPISVGVFTGALVATLLVAPLVIRSRLDAQTEEPTTPTPLALVPGDDTTVDTLASDGGEHEPDDDVSAVEKPVVVEAPAADGGD